jgi:hypothetical protein
METGTPKDANEGRLSYSNVRRAGTANLLLDHGLAQVIDRGMDAGSFAIIPDRSGGKLKQALYVGGFGWVSGDLGFWADALVRTAGGVPVAFDNHVVLVPSVSRDRAVDVARRVGETSVLFGSAGRFTCIDTAVRHSGRDCGWADVRPAFHRVTHWATQTAEASADGSGWSFAVPARRVGRHEYEYLFSRSADGTYPRTPTHFFFAGDVQHRRRFGLDPWAYSTPPLLTNYDVWLPLAAI